MRQNKPLVDVSCDLHHKGVIRPDTYVIDVDQIISNGKRMVEEAKKHGIKLYLMSKQYGRNPVICKRLMEVGFVGAVCVDFKEAQTLHQHGIKIGHVGHLVQVPSALVPKFVAMQPEAWTVYSYEKAVEINEAAKQQNIIQNIMVRVIEPGDVVYPGQECGFTLSETEKLTAKIKELSHVRLMGVTSFPCFLYDKIEKKIMPTSNAETVKAAAVMLKDLGFSIEQINMPSATACTTISSLAKYGATHGEPGHGLHGTTPLHAVSDEPEVPALVYVSEIAHKYNGTSYCYGGGHYRRSGVENALIQKQGRENIVVKVIPPSPEAIDYHFGLEGIHDVGATVIMAFRTQLFVTRSDVALVEGIQTGSPKLIGIYDTFGKELEMI
ncbi:YhfX family PLP-dependent enzyme [Bacillus sp. sid0103]|nr:YhfX family PLP-dependent enzyme [Bacillus sp. sid0103]